MPIPTITSARTPAHGLPYLYPGQAQKEPFVNEALARLDALVHPLVLGELAAPPNTPTSGDCYIVAGPATGVWTSHEGALATWAETQWLFAEPREGMRVHDAASGGLLVFTVAQGWRGASVPALPTGGATQDTEARAVLSEVVTKLHALGIFSA